MTDIKLPKLKEKSKKRVGRGNGTRTCRRFLGSRARASGLS